MPVVTVMLVSTLCSSARRHRNDLHVVQVKPPRWWVNAQSRSRYWTKSSAGRAGMAALSTASRANWLPASSAWADKTHTRTLIEEINGLW